MTVLLPTVVVLSCVSAHVFPELCYLWAIYEFAGCVIEKDTAYPGNDIGGGRKVKNQKACAALTGEIEGALFWTYHDKVKKCWIKTSKKGKKAAKGVVSGNNKC